MVSKKIYFIRHGQTQSEEHSLIGDDHLDSGLSEEGKLAVAKLRVRLADELFPGVVFTSTHRRAIETASLVYPNHRRIIALSCFNELYKGFDMYVKQFPDLALTTTIEWEQQHNNAILVADRLSFMYPSGATIVEMISTAWAGFQNILDKYPDEVIAIIAHNGPVKGIISQALGSLELYGKIKIMLAAYSALTYNSQGFTLDKLNA